MQRRKIKKKVISIFFFDWKKLNEIETTSVPKISIVFKCRKPEKHLCLESVPKIKCKEEITVVVCAKASGSSEVLLTYKKKVSKSGAF